MASGTWIKRAGTRILAAVWLVGVAVAGPVAASPAVPVVAAAQPGVAALSRPAASQPGLPDSPAGITNTLSLAGLGYIHIPNAPQLNPAGAITLEAWVRRSSVANCETVVAKNYNTGYWLGFCNGAIRFYTGNAVHADGVMTVTAGAWNHIAVSYDGCNIHFYLNGFLDQNYTCISPGSALPVTSDDWAIGANNTGANPFNGSLAEVRLWRTARTQADIRRNMLRVIDVADPDLAADWHLEGDAAEALGQFPGTAVGGVAFTGPDAPPTEFNPIQIPHLTVAPTVDGTCHDYEYAGLTLPIWYNDTYNGYGLRYVNVAATPSDVYVCLNALPIDTFTETFASLYLDLNASGGTAPQLGDYRLSGFLNGHTCANQHGNGVDDYTGSNALFSTACAVVENDEFQWSAELRFPRAAISGPNGLFRMQFIHHWKAHVGDDYAFPLDADWLQPQAWATFKVNDSLVVPADSQNPTIVMGQRPRPPHTTDLVTLDASANDDVDVASIELMVDSVTIKSCTFPGAHDLTSYCATTPQTFAVGVHGFAGRVTDRRGRLGFAAGSFLVLVDGHAPAILYRHSPRTPGLAASVTITATASDPSGIASLSILLGYGVPGSRSCAAAACSTTFSAPAGQRVVYYTVTARDHEGFTTPSPNIPILFGNTGPDSDGDHIVDAIEHQLCTNVNNPDTDGDALPDDWELRGISFGDFSYVNLPALGANPCRKDIYLQYDYERGAHAEPGVLPAVVTLFDQHGITLHLSENMRPRPGVLPTSTVGAEYASTTLDSGGHYYFDPKTAWYAHYMYSRHFPGTSGTFHYPTIDVNTNNCPLATADPQNDPACGPRNAFDQMYRIVHELGHTLGLGHGGRSGNKTFALAGDVVLYAGDWDSLNFKPNYLSVMNYGYNAVECWDPATGGRMTVIDYSDLDYGGLSEALLNEQPTSGFHTQVHALPCPGVPGMARMFFYSCTDTLGTQWQIASDGEHVNARLRSGSDWQTGPPSLPAGTDWNCNGIISAPGLFSSGNINGDGGSQPGTWFSAGTPGELLTSNNDWAGLPYRPSSVCYILNHPEDWGDHPGHLFPMDYINHLGHSDCLLSSVGTAAAASGPALGAPRFTDPHLHHTDPVQRAVNPFNWEACDGADNDGNAKVDEGCPDSDSDKIVDTLDNCPRTPNADQADFDANYLGDACQYPALLSLDYKPDINTMSLSWTATTTDVAGFALYRQCLGEASPQYLGSGYPTTTGLSYADTTAPNANCVYTVRPVNLFGVEGIGQTVNTWPVHVLLPAVQR